MDEYEIPLRQQGRGTELSSTAAVESLPFRRTNQDYDLETTVRIQVPANIHMEPTRLVSRHHVDAAGGSFGANVRFRQP